MSGGRFIAVVGPSGVGKDSVIGGLCVAWPGLLRVRRVITRPAEAGGEDHDAATVAGFDARLAAGEFVLSWHAHGLRYGIRRAMVADLDAGRDIIANLSRTALAAASVAFPGLVVLNLTARPGTLAARLGARGRESEDAIAARLAREAALPEGLTIIHMPNDGRLDDTVAAAFVALQAAKA